MASAALLVEGTDDLHVVWALLKHHDFPQVFAVKDQGGVEEVLKVLPVQLKGSDVTAVGVLIDADLNLMGRWKSLKAILDSAGYLHVPDLPPPRMALLSPARVYLDLALG